MSEEEAQSGFASSRGTPLEGLEAGCFAVVSVYVAGCVFVGLLSCLPTLGPSNIRSTETDAATLRQAMTLYRAEQPEAGCPTMKSLFGEYIDASMRVVDAWDRPFRLKCVGRDNHALSAGPDGKFGTRDDVPERVRRLVRMRSSKVSAARGIAPKQMRDRRVPSYEANPPEAVAR